MSKKEMTTEKRLKVRLYLSLLVYTVVGYGLTLILDYIFSKFDNGTRSLAPPFPPMGLQNVRKEV